MKKIYQFNNYRNSSTNQKINVSGLICLMFLSMIYLSFMLFNAILTNRYIGTNALFVLGGTFTSPFVFLIDNIVAEIYGFRITRSMILGGITAQTLFIILCQLVIKSPHPELLTTNHFYEHILGSSLFRIHLSGCTAYLLAMLLNAKILSYWKILLKGKKFWLRSIGACTISEALYSLIAIFLMQIQSIPLKNILQVIILSYFIKIIYNFLFILPSQIIVYFIRRLTGIDIYDFNKKFSPESQLTQEGIFAK